MKHPLALKLFVPAVLLLSFIVSAAQSNQSDDVAKSRELNASVMQLFSAGKYAEALPIARQALELREKALGGDNQELIPLLTNLAEITYALKSWEEADSFFRRALSLSEKTFGAKDARLAPLLERLAFVEHHREKDDAAEAFLLGALAIRDEAGASQHLEIAQTAFSLGQLYQLHNDYGKAKPMYERAISIWEQAGEGSQLKLLKALEADVLVLTALHKEDEASKLQRRVAELSAQDAIVNGGVLNGKALALVTPPYPPLARSDRASGTVRVQVLIDETGHVINAKALNAGSLHPALVGAAESAARKSRFSPTFFNGQPVKVNGIIIYNFVAQ